MAGPNFGTGCSISYDTGGGSYSAIIDVTSISGPGCTRSDIDITDLASTAKEFAAGMKDFGDISFVMNFDYANTTHSGLWSLYVSGATTNFRIAYANTDATTFTIAAYVRDFPLPDAGVDAVNQVTVTLRTSGAGTWSL